MPAENPNGGAPEGRCASKILGCFVEENWNRLPGDTAEPNVGVNDFEDNEDGEVDEGNLEMKGGGVDGGVSSPSEDGVDDSESLDANDTSEGVREMVERDRVDGKDDRESEETLATLSGASEGTFGAVGACIGNVEVDMGARLVGNFATFLLRWDTDVDALETVMPRIGDSGFSTLGDDATETEDSDCGKRASVLVGRWGVGMAETLHCREALNTGC